MNPDDLIPAKRFFRPDEVAQLFDLSRRTVYRMIRDGRLSSVRLGGGSGPIRVSRDTLLQHIPSA